MDRYDADRITQALANNTDVHGYKLKYDNDRRNEFIGIYLVRNPRNTSLHDFAVEIHIHWGDVGEVRSANIRWPGEPMGQSVRLHYTTTHECEAALGHKPELATL
ncbi:hypothetical protein [Hyalangium gracile]|uniref:hypothetical protein n=1 Tax=Hyalangium gracile TaxID=394092 RepID=UPI001CC8F0BA|nr:hypothetical protein [Hyalangium gracile]